MIAYVDALANGFIMLVLMALIVVGGIAYKIFKK